MPGSSRLIFHIRHGETDWNSQGRLQGASDVPLNDVGRTQADAAGAALARHLATIGRAATSFRWLSSPLGRARETMERVRRSVGLPSDGYETRPGLAEISFGSFEGLTPAEIEAVAPGTAAAKRRSKWTFTPPGGENYAALLRRVRPVFADLDEDLVIVSHCAVFRTLCAVFEKSEDPAFADLDVPQGGIYVWEGTSAHWL